MESLLTKRTMWRRFVRAASALGAACRCRARQNTLYDGKDEWRRPARPVQTRAAMRDFQRPMPASRRDVTADSGAMLRTLAHLWPYIWSANRPDLKNRVIFATVLLFVAQLATVAGPFTFKGATDALAGHGTAPLGPDNILAWALATPVMMTLAYGGMRILMAALTQLRDGIFAKVAMNAVRRLAMLTFEHMHMLSLRFHLERKTGGLTRVLESGRNALQDTRGRVAPPPGLT